MKKFALSPLLITAILHAAVVIASARQADEVYRIGLLISANNQVASFTAAFREGMRDRGYLEGKNYVLGIFSPGVKSEPLAELVTGLLKLKVDVIVAVGFPAVDAAKKATWTIPIVMRMSVDPVKSGLIASLARPGGNLTGVVSMGVGLTGKRFDLLAETVPGIKRVAVLTTSHDYTTTDWFKELDAASRALRTKLQVVEAQDPVTIDSAFLEMKKMRAEGLIVIPNARYVQYKERIVQHATNNRLPSIFAHSTHVESGGLMSYGANPEAEFRQTATFVDKIIKGRKPLDLPVEQPIKFYFVINLKTAKEIGVTIPQWTLMKADRVIR